MLKTIDLITCTYLLDTLELLSLEQQLVMLIILNLSHQKHISVTI